ncbi:DUF4230 domain-containing protein [Corynebacterium sp. CNCTC7651]|uniref:DUF4230 domain-containing protein n=1 Tax=Corynebacterium sp. CNCTC7651 TaxID=2815361 RepID=UPI001F279E4E|nr:DUF4230 domain-containing protein [Corynebacterium sp. CNCTC7651]
MSTAAKMPRPVRRAGSRAVGCLGAIAITLGLLLAAVFLRPSLFGMGEERITAESIGASFNEVAELSVEEYVYSNVGSYDKEGLLVRGFEVPFTGRNFLVTYDGKVTAGIRNAEGIRVSVDDVAKAIEIQVPPVEVLSSNIDASSVVVHDQSMNPLNQVRVDDVTRFIAEQEKLAEDKAVEQGLLERASSRVGELLEAHARAMAAGTALEGYEVRVRLSN